MADKGAQDKAAPRAKSHGGRGGGAASGKNPRAGHEQPRAGAPADASAAAGSAAKAAGAGQRRERPTRFRFGSGGEDAHHATVLTLRVRLRVWIPTEDVPRLQKSEFFSGLRRSELNVDTVVPDASFSGSARATGPATAAAAQQSAWREIQLLGEARDAFEAFAQLEQRVEEVDDVVLAFPMAKVRGGRWLRRQRGCAVTAEGLCCDGRGVVL
jgi:hypothetical protein